MKRLKQIIPVLLLALFGCCMHVMAADTEENEIIKWQVNENHTGAALTLTPTQEMVEDAVTAVQITVQISGAAESGSGVSVAFSEETAGAYRIADYTYKAETGELNIFLSDARALFAGDAKSCTIGTVNINTDAGEYQISFLPVAVKTVDQSHITGEIPAEALQNAVVTLQKISDGEEEPDPEPKPNPDAGIDNAKDVVEELNSGELSEVIFNIGKEADVSKEDQKSVFAALKGKDKALTFAVSDGGRLLYSFTFRGDQITNENISVDFELISGVQNQEIESLMEEGAKNLILDFSHSGKLPGAAEVKVYVGEHFTDGQKLYLYYYNPDTRKIEPIKKDIIVVEGYVTFELEHCSTYVLTTKEVKAAGAFPMPGEETSTGGTGGGSGQIGAVSTGDTAPVMVLIALLIVSAILIAGVVWKKKH